MLLFICYNYLHVTALPPLYPKPYFPKIEYLKSTNFAAKVKL